MGKWVYLTEKLLKIKSRSERPNDKSHMIACINMARMARKLLQKAQRTEEEYKEQADHKVHFNSQVAPQRSKMKRPSLLQ